MLKFGQLIGFGGSEPFLVFDPFFSIIQNEGLATNLQLCLDAGDLDSYDTAVDDQKWRDTSGGGHDLFLGASGTATTDDPTFSGILGERNSNTYFSYDGGDNHNLVAASNPAWVETFHKNSAALTIALWGYFPDTGAALDLTGTCNTGNTGFIFQLLSSEVPFFQIRNAGAVVLLSGTADNQIGINTPTFVAVSLDEAAGAGGGFFYTDGDYNPVSASNTWDATYSSPSAANATNPLKLGSNGAGTGKLRSGTRLYGAMYWDAALTKANLDTIYNATKSRFGL